MCCCPDAAMKLRCTANYQNREATRHQYYSSSCYKEVFPVDSSSWDQ